MRTLLVIAALGLAACAGEPEPRRGLTVAAAANLDGVLGDLAERFRAESGIPATVSFGSTSALAQQIENGAPFDVFLSADVEHVDALIASGLLAADTRAVYARGRLVVWSPSRPLAALSDLRGPDFRFVALAKPEFAPYGRAAAEALRNAGLWERIEPKIVYAQNVRMARQFAESGNADAAWIAASLAQGLGGDVLDVDPNLHAPIDQALAVSTASALPGQARAFTRFLLSDAAQERFRNAGYRSP